MVDIAIFASGNGGNFERIVKALENKEASNFRVKLLLVDKESAFAIERAKRLGVKHIYVNPKEYSSKAEFEGKIVEILEENSVEYIVLAGYMRIISSTLLERYSGKIINIHPSYLPEFPGKDGIGDAFKAGVRQTGVTIHFVDSGIDTGKIIYQERVRIEPDWSLEKLEEEIHKVEHRIYPEVLTNLFKKGGKL